RRSYLHPEHAMGRPFSLTTSTTSIKLDTRRRGTVVFTVTNGLGGPANARASLAITPPALPTWGRVIVPEAALDAEGTDTFEVMLQVPRAAPAGSYSFRLLVADVANPDEEYVESDEIRFEVSGMGAGPSRFPWWLLASGGGAILVAGLVVAL